MEKDEIDQLLESAIVEFEHKDFAQPHSLTEDGEIATLGDYIAQTRPDMAQNINTKPRSAIRPIASLNDEELKQLAIAAFEYNCAIGSGATFPPDFDQEIENQTELGKRFIFEVKTYTEIVERAVETGKFIIAAHDSSKSN